MNPVKEDKVCRKIIDVRADIDKMDDLGVEKLTVLMSREFSNTFN
jgi:hypothetical protein